MGVSFIWITLMRMFAKYMIWLSIACLFVITGFLAYESGMKYLSFGQQPAAPANNTVVMARSAYFTSSANRHFERYTYPRTQAGNEDLLTFDYKQALMDQLDSYTNNQTLWLVVTIVLGVIFVLMGVMLCCFIKRIQIAIAVIEEASK